MGRLFDFAKFKANIVMLFRFGASFFQPKAFFMWIYNSYKVFDTA